MKSWQHNVLTCAAVAASLLWHGCSGEPVGGAGGGEDLAMTGRTVPGEFKLLGSEPVPFAGKGDPTHFELLADPDFDVFVAGGSPEWATKHIGWRQLSGNPASIQAIENETNGGVVLSFQPSNSPTALQQTTADLGPLRKNAWLVATMRANAAAPYMLGIALSFPGRGDHLELAEGHPGDGQWHDVALRVPVPDGLRQNQFKCTVVHREGGATPASVQSVHLRIEYPDQTSPPTNLVLNGGFESYGFTTPPYPWKLDRWNSNLLPIVGGDALLVPANGLAEGAFAISFTRPNEASVVRISQPVLKVSQSDAGTTLVAKAIGIASHDKELWIQLRAVKGGRDIGNQKAFTVHPGDGEWHEFSVEFIVPRPNIADTVYVDAFRRSHSDNEAIVDSIQVERVK